MTTSDPRAMVVVGLVEREGEVLIARKRVVEGHFLSGQWHVPGGRVEAGEPLEDAVKREIREEAGIEVDVVESLGVVELEEQRAKVHWFRCVHRGGELRAGDDVVEVEYVAPGEAVRRFPPDSARHFPDAVKVFFGLARGT
jgi:8-oxo-dGTP diphosphatase